MHGFFLFEYNHNVACFTLDPSWSLACRVRGELCEGHCEWCCERDEVCPSAKLVQHLLRVQIVCTGGPRLVLPIAIYSEVSPREALHKDNLGCDWRQIHPLPPLHSRCETSIAR